MNPVVTALIYAGIPLGLFLILAVLVYGRSIVRPNRYRPGRPWSYPPVWYLPHLTGTPASDEAARPALAAGAEPSPSRRALAAGAEPSPAGAEPTGATPTPVPSFGGASGEW